MSTDNYSMTDLSITELLDELRVKFIEELPSRIAEIEDNILSITNENSHDELFRHVHSLKGSAGSYNFHIITKITHHLEDVMLDYIKQKTFNSPEAIDLFLEYVDLMKNVTNELIKNQNNPRFFDGFDGFEVFDDLLDSLHAKVFSQNVEVLMVEPSKAYIRLFEERINNLPIKLTVVQDGFSALSRLLSKKYALLITALETPPLNADAVIAALRSSHCENKDITTILITSSDRSKVQNSHLFTEIMEKNVLKNGKLIEKIKPYIVKN